jgi:hypothetical protein
MAHNPSLLPVLKEFGISPGSLSELLQVTDGFIAGGCLSSAFFGESIEEQDLNIWIPVQAEPKVAFSHFKVVHHLVSTFLTSKKQLSKDMLLGMSLDEIPAYIKGYYKNVKAFKPNEFTELPFVRITYRFENPWTGQNVNVIYTTDMNVKDVMSKFDLDINQFWSNGSNNFQIYSYNTDPNILTNLRNGFVKILVNSDELSINQSENLAKRIAVFESFGYKFNWSADGRPWNHTQLADAPTESFWQDFIFTTNEPCVDHPDYIYSLLDEAGCNFKGAETDVNVKIIQKYIEKRIKLAKADDDIWQYTFRFTWNAKEQSDNIYLIQATLLNPF